MASTAYYTWKAAGEPYRLTTPAQELEDLLREYEYTVYDYPDDRHLEAVPPEDHTPFSATEWPIRISAYIGHALDIMPPGLAALNRGAVPLPTLARRIIRDRDAKRPGTMWIKYMNWTDENGRCRHESWQGAERVTTDSTDKGHIHLSGRTDTQTYHIGDWNPVMASQLTPTEQLFLIELAYRCSAVLFDYDKTGEWTDPRDGKTVRNEPNNLKQRMLAEHAEVMAQLRANGQTLSQILAEVQALKVGGLDPAALQAAVVGGVKTALREGSGS